MIDVKVAGDRLITIASWLMGFSMVLIALSLEILSQKPPVFFPWNEVVEAFTLILEIISLIMYTTAATCLCSPYYEKESKEEMVLKEIDAIRVSRRLLVIGTVILFWALGGLVLLSFDFQFRAFFYSIICIIAPLIWLGLRKCLAKAPF